MFIWWTQITRTTQRTQLKQSKKISSNLDETNMLFFVCHLCHKSKECVKICTTGLNYSLMSNWKYLHTFCVCNIHMYCNTEKLFFPTVEVLRCNCVIPSPLRLLTILSLHKGGRKRSVTEKALQTEYYKEHPEISCVRNHTNKAPDFFQYTFPNITFFYIYNYCILYGWWTFKSLQVSVILMQG